MAKKYLTDRAYAAIKDWIIRYDLKPGAHLRFDGLTAALDMSQTPIREALSKLEQERFVERHPKKGYVVRSLTLQEVEDIYDLRIALEVLAAQQAAVRMTAADQDRLADILHRAAGVITAGDRAQTLELERKFHAVIMEASGNKLLSETGRGILDRIWIIQNINILTSDRLNVAHGQHLEILAALQEKNPDQAGALMRNHLSSAKEFVIARMRDTNDVLAKVVTGFPEPARALDQR